MKIQTFLFTALLFCGILFSASRVNAQASGNYFLNEKGDTIKVKGDIKPDGKTIAYTDMNGKAQSIDAKKVQYLVSGTRHYKTLPVYLLNMNKLQEIVASNKNYILTSCSDDGLAYLYIWTNHYENKEKQIYLGNTPEDQQRAIDKSVKKYFSACTDLLNQMKANIKAGKDFNEGLHNYVCVTKEE